MDLALFDRGIVMDVHHESRSRHGGMDGLRDEVAFLTALAAAETTCLYSDGDVHDVAASYAFHLAEAQAFLDGKRAAIGSAALYDARTATARRELDKPGLPALQRTQVPRI